MAVWCNTTLSEISLNRRIDSEFFRPFYIKTESTVLDGNKVIMLGKVGKFIIGPFGSAFHVSNYEVKSNYRYIRGKDVKPFQLLDDDNVYIPEDDYNRLSRYSISENDLIISVVGTIGNVSIIPEGEKGIFSCKSTIFREINIDPYFLLGYLNSKYGRTCLLRRQRGAIQMGLNLEDLNKVPVPIFPKSTMVAIGNLIRQGLKLNQESKLLYSQSTQMLEKELGLDKVNLENRLYYSTKISNIITGKRTDSQNLQPKFENLISHLKNHFTCNLLGLMSSVNRRGTQPIYDANGTKNIINSQHITSTHLKYENFEKTTSSEFGLHPEAHVQYGDILVYTTGAYVGQTNAYLQYEPALASNHVNILRLKKDVDPAYVALVLNTLIGKTQTEKHIRGSAQAELYPNDLAKFIIPLLDKSIMTEIGDFVRDSLQVLIESKKLLEQAKSEVETLIEQAANKS